MNIMSKPFPTSQSEQYLLEQIAALKADHEKQIKPLMDALIRHRSMAQQQHYVDRAEWLAFHAQKQQQEQS
jgi:hypothetical protein